MKPYQIFLLLIVFILIAVLVPFYLLTKDNLHYEYIGSSVYIWDEEEPLIEDNTDKEETEFIHTSWYKVLKEKIEQEQWNNKEIKRGTKEDPSEEYYYDERGNNGYAASFEKGEFTYIALTPGVSVTTIHELKVKRMHEKEDEVIVELKTINGMDTFVEKRILFLRMKTSDLEGKELVVRRNVEGSMGRTFIDEIISSF